MMEKDGVSVATTGLAGKWGVLGCLPQYQPEWRVPHSFGRNVWQLQGDVPSGTKIHRGLMQGYAPGVIMVDS